jgi:hypothetical protein
MWLLDLRTADTRRIAEQPPDTSENSIFRSRPTWSPDSHAVAWTEIVFAGQKSSYRLIIYSLKTGETRRVILKGTPKPGPTGYITLPIVWGKSGLAVFDALQDPPRFTVYTAAGFRLFSGEVDYGLPWIEQFTWLEDGDKEYLAFVVPTQTRNPGPAMDWFVLDAKRATFSPLNGIAELYSLSAPSGLSIYSTASEKGNAVWHLADRQADLAIIDDYIEPDSMFSRLTIAPDGKNVAYITSQRVGNETEYSAVVRDGKGGKLMLNLPRSYDTPSIAWGATGWRVRRVSAPIPK